MSISILLPYKENFSHEYAGAVSIFINAITKKSIYKNDITIYGSTKYKNKLSKNYINIPLAKKLLKSQSKDYVEKFKALHSQKKAEIIEIHNRPNYIKHLISLSTKLILYFHNDPLTMDGSSTINERIYLLNSCERIVFNSEWSKKQFLKKLPQFYHKSKKFNVIHQSVSQKKINLKKKKKIITFVGKLNTAKGFDLFSKAIVKILNDYPDWKAFVAGDEPRENISVNHKNLINLGFQDHDKILNLFEKSSIAVTCSRWQEPFGRTSLEASSRGCAVIISNKGGLPETITDGIILRKLDVDTLYKSIKKLVLNPKQLKELQINSYKNFYLTDKFISKKIDAYRNEIFNSKTNINLTKKIFKRLKILHITNFNERHNGRLFYNTGKRLNNGFIRLGHSVLEFSDRDIVSYYRSLTDYKGQKRLNNKLIEVISNYVPDLIVLGHADLIKVETLEYIKTNYPNIKICQWFLDRMDDKWLHNKERFLDKINLTDANFCTSDPKSLSIANKYNVQYIPNPVDESFEILKNFENKYFNNDVFFAMSHGVHRGELKKGKFDERENFINKLLKKTPNTRFDIYGMNNVQPIWADDYLSAISQSKIGLNISQGKPSKYYSSDRVSQLIGNGLLVMIDEKTKFGNFFSKDEIILYKNISDLSEKIIKFSKDYKMRNKIAKKGREKYFKFFNSTIVSEFIINKTYNVNKKYYWEHII
jgi:glycosyltransferase involved in cell wall biosynthesis